MIVGKNILYSCLTVLVISSQSYGNSLRGPPRVETEVYLLDSYIPAAMQVIAYLSEMMKYEIKPPSVSTTPSSFVGNTKPTSTHKPAVFAPEKPPGPDGYEKLGDDHNLQKSLQLDNENYEEDKLKHIKSTPSVDSTELPENLENMIGERAADLLKYLFYETAPRPYANEDEQVQIFSEDFDDSDFRFYLQQNKRKTPPTRAYVTLLSLYDLLSKDAKKQGLSKYQGYYDHVLIELSKTSSGTSANQLKFVLQKIITNQDTKQPDVKKKIDSLLEDLKNEKSYLHEAIKDIEPLQFRL